MTALLWIVDATLLILGLFWLRQILAKPSTPLPPGPKGLPLIGNVLDMPKAHEWFTFSNWARRWGRWFDQSNVLPLIVHPLVSGNMIHLKTLGQSVIVLSTYEVAVETLDRKSAIYSDRPTMITADNFGLRPAASVIHSGDTHREYRRMMNKTIGTREAIQKLHGLIEREGRTFLRRVLHEPGHVHQQVRK